MTTPQQSNVLHPMVAQLADEPGFYDHRAIGFVFNALTFAAAHLTKADAQEHAMIGSDQDFWGDNRNPYRPYIVKDGILQVPVHGVLLNKFPYQLGRWATGYEYIERAIVRGVNDGNVKGIALMVDSPGGVVAGCFECADKIYGMRREKPIQAFAADSAYSAAYALASSAARITVTRSGGTGSVGVVMGHVDYSAMMEQVGIKVTLIYAGKHKVDGNPYEPLPEAVKESLQKRIDKLYAVFVSTVARNRNLGEDAIRKTEAMCYDAEDSVSVGFADAVGATDDISATFAELFTQTETEEMTDKNQNEPTITAAQVESARAEGMSAGAAAERARIVAILGSEEAKTRPVAAMAAALETDLSAEAASKFIAKLPSEAKVEAPKQEAPKGSPFNSAMSKTPNPDVGADAGDEGADGDEDPEAAAAASIRAAGRRAMGGKPKKAA